MSSDNFSLLWRTIALTWHNIFSSGTKKWRIANVQIIATTRIRLIPTKSLERVNGIKRILPSENCKHSNQKSRLPAKCKIERRTSAQFARWWAGREPKEKTKKISREIERRRSEKRNDSFWSKDDEKEGVREDSTRRALSPVGRRYKGETVSQFTNPDFRSRTSIRVFTLTAPISFLSISLLRDRRRKGRLASQTRSGRFAIRSPRGLLLENSYSHEFYRRDRTSRVVCIPLSPSAFLY